METEISTAIRGQISEAEVICSELSVTVGEYHQAIEALWTHAMAETGERRPASLVLLGAYDPQTGRLLSAISHRLIINSSRLHWLCCGAVWCSASSPTP